MGRLRAKITWLSLILGILSLLLGCGTSNQSDEGDSSSSRISTVYQPDALWSSGQIPVCWEAATVESSSFRSSVATFVNKGFSGTPIRFTGWSSCTNNFNGVRIFIYDAPGNVNNSEAIQLQKILATSDAYPGHPRLRNRRLGQQIAGMRAGLILTYDFTDVAPELSSLQNQYAAYANNLRLSIALHEFGHAIGLRHEDEHPQSICFVGTQVPLGTGQLAGNGYDSSSFMNQCYYKQQHNYRFPLSLSNSDKVGINQVY